MVRSKVARLNRVLVVAVFRNFSCQRIVVQGDYTNQNTKIVAEFRFGFKKCGYALGTVYYRVISNCQCVSVSLCRLAEYNYTIVK